MTAASVHSQRVVTFGFDDAFFEAGKHVPVSWCEEFATNGHMLIAGKSGTGKTFTLQRIISQLIRPLPGRVPPRVHVFDVHNDIRFDDESRIMFSESSPYGINPLRLSCDPHYGGVRKCVESFIEMMSESSGALGSRQVPALKNVLYDLYAERGFVLHDASTWRIDDDGDSTPDSQGRIYLDIPYEDRELAKGAAKSEHVTLQWDGQEKSWWCSEHRGALLQWSTRIRGRRAPTVPDAMRFVLTKIRRMQVGGSGKCIHRLEEHNKKVQTWRKLAHKLARTGLGEQEVEDIKKDVHQGSLELIESFTEYVLAIEEGTELDQVLRFDSIETLKSIADRLSTLLSSGIFRPRRPDFDESRPIWSYGIAPLRDPEQKFFVWTCLRQIFENAKEMGAVAGASEVREVIVLDEAHKFFNPKDTNILDILSREARKFGIALIAASQAPSHFSEDFLGNVGTKVLLGLDEQYHDWLLRKMRIDREILSCVAAKRIAAIQIADKRNEINRFMRTRVGR